MDAKLRDMTKSESGDSRLTVLYNLLKKEGYCPESDEDDNFISVFYRGQMVYFGTHEEDQYCCLFCVGEYEDKQLLESALTDYQGLMSYYPVLQILGNDNSLFIRTQFSADMHDNTEFLSLMYSRLEALHGCAEEIKGHFGYVDPDYQRDLVLHYLKENGCQPYIEENAILFKYYDVSCFHLFLDQWGFTVGIKANVELDDEKLLPVISALSAFEAGKYYIQTDGEDNSIIVSHAQYYPYNEWDNKEFFLKRLQNAVDIVCEAYDAFFTAYETIMHGENADYATIESEARVSAENSDEGNFQIFFNSLKHYGYKPEKCGDGMLHFAILDDNIHLVLESSDTNNYYRLYAGCELSELEEDAYSASMVAELSQQEVPRCFIVSGEETQKIIKFEIISQIPDDRDEKKFFWQFREQVRQIERTVNDYVDMRADFLAKQDGNHLKENDSESEYLRRAFKYLSDVGITAEEPEDNAVGFVYEESWWELRLAADGVLVAGYILSDEKKCHDISAELEIADEIMNTALDLLQIIRFEHEDSHGMAFRLFFDCFPAEDADEFVNDVKEAVKALYSYENEFIEKLHELERTDSDKE